MSECLLVIYVMAQLYALVRLCPLSAWIVSFIVRRAGKSDFSLNICRAHLLRDKFVRSPYAWLKTAPPSFPKVP